MLKANACLAQTIILVVVVLATNTTHSTMAAMVLGQDPLTAPPKPESSEPASDRPDPSAEETNAGVAEAHLWLAEKIQKTPNRLDAKTRQARVQEQIDLALAAGPLTPMAHLDLGVIYERRAKRIGEKSDEYQECLKSVVKHFYASTSGEVVSLEQVGTMLRLIHYHQVLGSSDERVLEIANEMIEKIHPFAKENPNEILGWLALIECATKTKQYELAEKLVRDRLVSSSSNEVRHKVVDHWRSALIQQADGYSDMSDDVAYRKRLALLFEAIYVGAKDAQVYSRLLEYITGEPNGFHEPGRLEKALPESKRPGLVHSLIGLSAAIDGDLAKARSHWKIAEHQVTFLPVVLSELLKAGIRSDAAEFSDPLPIFKIAIESLSSNAPVFQLRGFYFRTKGLNADAVVDLEAAVKEYPKLIEARKLLIVLYTESGDTTKADDHQQKLDAILAEMPVGQRWKTERQLKSIK